MKVIFLRYHSSKHNDSEKLATQIYEVGKFLSRRYELLEANFTVENTYCGYVNDDFLHAKKTVKITLKEND